MSEVRLVVREAECDCTPVEAQRLIDQLNRDFGNLRELFQQDDSSLTEALIDPVFRRFDDTLEAVASSRPDVAPKSERVRSILETLVDSPHTSAGWDSDVPGSPYLGGRAASKPGSVGAWPSANHASSSSGANRRGGECVLLAMC